MGHRREMAEVSRKRPVSQQRLVALGVTVDEMRELIAHMRGRRNGTALQQDLIALQATLDELRELIAGLPGSRPKAARRLPQIGRT